MSRRPLDDLFGALADPTRRGLLERLIHEGPRTATQLAAGSAVSRQAIVKHLQALTAVDLVAAERCGARSATGRRPSRSPPSSTGCAAPARRGIGAPSAAPARHELTGRCSARKAIVFAHAERAAASSWNIGASSSKAWPAISTLSGDRAATGDGRGDRLDALAGDVRVAAAEVEQRRAVDRRRCRSSIDGTPDP